jgi:hypothetical protein
MPHDRSTLIGRVSALLTQQRYNPVVIHNQSRGAWAECSDQRKSLPQSGEGEGPPRAPPAQKRGGWVSFTSATSRQTGSAFNRR